MSHFRFKVELFSLSAHLIVGEARLDRRAIEIPILIL